MELLYDGHSWAQTVCPDQQPVQYTHFGRKILCELSWGLIIMSGVLTCNSGVAFKTGPTGYGCVSRRYMQV